ncbi:crossover junction endonuclease MUS81-like [Patiria miniata]|uniref:Crossover junction endonuclease MUS81 n=1 Tax=Patiria miniata TaxID=46514 RepID=A0A914BD13_PATMI|nr:crossover junction endonuclease MUS81-like [Patiria miniata]
MSSFEPAPKKRKKKLEPCPNPLFVKWLTEWRDEAASQGKKTQYAFGKALYALKKYPMLLKTGREAKILDNFGDKICNMLDHKLAKHIEENGDPSLSSLALNHTGSSSASSPPPSALSRDDDILTIPPAPDDGALVDKTRKRRPSNRGPREYVPVYRSGPYALILTLYREYKKPTSRGFMLKTELQRQAQPLSEKSFTIPDPGSHYTAWSSMSTLITKGYVSKEGNPARYSVTDAGCQLANKLETVEAQFGQHTSRSPPIGGAVPVNNKPTAPTGQSRKRKEATRSDPTLHPTALPHTATSLATRHDAPLSRDAPPPTQGDKLEYWYIDDHGNKVITKDDAAVTVDDEISIGFLIKANETALKKSGVRYKRDYSIPAEGCMIFAYLHNDDAIEYCPIPTLSVNKVGSGSRNDPPPAKDPLPNLPSLTTSKTTSLPKVQPKKKKPQQRHVDKQTDSQLSTASSVSTSSNRSTTKTASQLSRASSDAIPPSASNGLKFASDVAHQAFRHSQSSELDSQTSSVSAFSTASSISDRLGSLQGSSSQDSHGRSSASSKEPPVPLYVLEPGTFDIVLCVDNCETSGGSAKSRKQLLLPELQKNGVMLDVRKLQVGDFLWIAREKRVPVPGMLQMPTAREVALDYVVERKRMDDLCGSITDGRFKEQKFRLKQSGLRKPIYLIEDFGSIDHLSIPASTLKQATINTQVIDGFFVKHTRDIKESAAYLTIMTRYLNGHYSNKTLKAFRRDDLDRLPSNPSLTDRVQKLMTFSEVNDSSVKNKNTTVTETFAKQLLQFSGLTAEKALAITRLYPTPSHLLDAYDTCAIDKDREKLLSLIKYGKLQRNVGPVLSKLIHMFYCTDRPLS